MTRLLLVVIGILFAALWLERVRGNRARASGVKSALVRDSVEAAHDSTREAGILQLHDSVRVVERRAQQQEQRADNLDRTLRAHRLARISTQVRVAALDTAVRTDTVYVTVDSTRRSRFTVRQAPYTVVGEIALRPSRRDSVSLHVELDSIALEVRLSCQRGVGTPVNRASVALVAPRWARVVIGVVEQAASVCNPELTPPTVRGRLANLVSRIGVSAGAGIVVEHSTQIIARPALLLGIRIWP
jgi:hypothetical protein